MGCTTLANENILQSELARNRAEVSCPVHLRSTFPPPQYSDQIVLSPLEQEPFLGFGIGQILRSAPKWSPTTVFDLTSHVVVVVLQHTYLELGRRNRVRQKQTQSLSQPSDSLVSQYPLWVSYCSPTTRRVARSVEPTYLHGHICCLPTLVSFQHHVLTSRVDRRRCS